MEIHPIDKGVHLIFEIHEWGERAGVEFFPGSKVFSLQLLGGLELRLEKAGREAGIESFRLLEKRFKTLLLPCGIIDGKLIDPFYFSHFMHED